MAILWSMLALVFGLGAGALGMRWHVERTREIAAQEDTRDTQIRELLAALKLARGDLAKTREQAASATVTADQTHQRIEELEQQLAEAHQLHENTRELLNEEIAEKTVLQEELIQLRRECEALRTRVQELELEAQASEAGDLLDPMLVS